MPYASAGILHVAVVARDYVNVEVVHRLACCLASIETNVETGWAGSAGKRPLTGLVVQQVAANLVDESHDRSLFLGCRIPPLRNHPAGDHEDVAGRHRELVTDREGEVVGSHMIRPGDRQERNRRWDGRLRHALRLAAP
jgi:hypothetical protein